MGIFLLCSTPLLFLEIRKTRLYLVDFFSDSEIVRIRYYKGTKELIKETRLTNTNAILKNTASRSGFDCELRLTINDTKFIINDKYDWSLEEIKYLFEYIKTTKKDSYSEMDILNLSKIEEKVMKLNVSKSEML
ncbi:hypothetical protein [Kordia sp.]|uniref:hypothetical protein n=1 Tax=Kordia sp. TaxID=1965332 RepID=UPI003B5A14C3